MEANNHPTEERAPGRAVATLPASIANLKLLAARSESARFAMTGMLVEVDGESYACTVTDGRVFLSARGSNSGCEGKGSILVPLNMPPQTKDLSAKDNLSLKDAMQGLKADGWLKIMFESGSPVIRVAGTNHKQMDLRTLDGRFPKYRSIIPKGRPQFVMSFNPFYLHKLLSAMLPFFPEDNQRVKLCMFKPEAPLCLVAEAGGVALDGLIMPLS